MPPFQEMEKDFNPSMDENDDSDDLTPFESVIAIVVDDLPFAPPSSPVFDNKTITIILRSIEDEEEDLESLIDLEQAPRECLQTEEVPPEPTD
ncbi:hypothetical protein J1N35_041006 [Gossypium stocksii]|uniref:Uncharacterized protein n=1 Tax=Gossypium stocksii TaxID=47602 RepID=A0A9D3UFA8_9ROSI|nr:hypothetical protein J1N35_041006 [Gossypium stocksii]